MPRKAYPKLRVISSPNLFPTELPDVIEVSLASRPNNSVHLRDPADRDLLEDLKTGRITISRARQIAAARVQLGGQS
jgi:hypothetical protein